MSEFVLMLTRNDLTVPDAPQLLQRALTTGTRHIGFKDVGQPLEVMRDLVESIHGAGCHAHLEVVSLTEEDERQSLQIGLDLGFDYILGGTRPTIGREMLAGTTVTYFPYVGHVVGHPGTLEGSVDEILDGIEGMSGMVDGVNLLAYRHTTISGDEIVAAVCAQSSVPVLVAGSIASLERVRRVTEAGAWGFTIGAAALDLQVVPGADFEAQLHATLQAAALEEVGR